MPMQPPRAFVPAAPPGSLFKVATEITRMGIAKVTRNYQVTIPRDVREAEGILIGDTLIFSLRHGGIEIVKKGKDALIRDVAGTWKGPDGLAYARAIRSEWEQRKKRMKL